MQERSEIRALSGLIVDLSSIIYHMNLILHMLSVGYAKTTDRAELLTALSCTNKADVDLIESFTIVYTVMYAAQKVVGGDNNWFGVRSLRGLERLEDWYF